MAEQADLQGAMAAGAIFKKITDQYPEFAPLFEAVPELRPLFIQAISAPGGGWNPDKFAEEFRKTDWYKHTPTSQRTWLGTTIRDPAGASRTRQQTIQQYYDIAAQMGISIPTQNMYMLAEAGLRLGWDDNEVKRALLEQARSGDPLAGTVDSTATQLRNLAYQWGVPYSDQASFDRAKKIAGGRGTIDGFQEEMRQHAKALFPAWAEQIDNGVTVQDLSEPYRQLATTTLEINPNDFNLQDSRWRRLFQQKNEKGQWTPMTLADAETSMMTDPRYGWDRTKNAREGAVNLVQQMQQSFGSAA